MSTDLYLDRYSSVADFELIAAGHSYDDVAQIAPDFIILDRPRQIPPGPAELIIRLDGREIRRNIEILPATDPKSRRIPIARP